MTMRKQDEQEAAVEALTSSIVLDLSDVFSEIVCVTTAEEAVMMARLYLDLLYECLLP